MVLTNDNYKNIINADGPRTAEEFLNANGYKYVSFWKPVTGIRILVGKIYQCEVACNGGHSISNGILDYGVAMGFYDQHFAHVYATLGSAACLLSNDKKALETTTIAMRI